MAEVKGKIAIKYESGKAIKIDDVIYSVRKKEELDGVSKGDEVVVTFEKNGSFNNIKKIEKVTKEQKASEFKCEVCGKDLKDGKYKKCYECNKKGASTSKTAEPRKEEPASEKEAQKKEPYEEVIKYGSPADITGKEVGCAINAAATVAGGQQFIDDQGNPAPEKALEFVKTVAQGLLIFMRANK